MQSLCENLKRTINELKSRQEYRSAAFFADKLVTMSGGTEESVIELAECMFGCKEYRRAIHILLNTYSLHSNRRAVQLAALSASELSNWEECIEILGEQPQESKAENKGIESSICLLRGRALLAIENRTAAVTWFKEALKKNIYNSEAFDFLLEHAESEVVEFVNGLNFTAEALWLKQFYISKVKKFDAKGEQKVRETLTELENKFHLKGNTDIAVISAELSFYLNNFQKSYDITKRLLEEDPYNHGTAAVIHVSSLVELKLKNELYYCAHKLVEDNPNIAVSWYAVACYYYLISNHENARRYFNKCTTIDPHFGAAWIGYGHSFAAQGEHDQAMAAYRTAARILTASQLPSLCIGMELIRVNNFHLASQYVEQAKLLCDSDPLIYNELGVIAFKDGQYAKAADYFSKAVELSGSSGDTSIAETFEPTIVNLAHCHRKLRNYDAAVKYYRMSLVLNPNNANTHSALAFTYQLQHKYDLAIEFYHKALGIKPEDSVASTQLNIVMAKSLELKNSDLLAL